MYPGVTTNPLIVQELFDRLNIGCIIFELAPELTSFLKEDEDDFSILDLKDQLTCTVTNKILRDTLQINPTEKPYTLKDWVKDFPEAYSHLKVCSEETEVKFELFIERLGKNGAWIEGEYISKFDQQGGFQGLMGIFRDVTKKKKLEKKVIQEKHKLEYAELILEISQKLAKIGTWRIDLNTKKLSFTDTLYKLYDFPPGVDNLYEVFLNSIHEEDRDHFNSTVQHALQTGSSYTVEFRIVRRGGEIAYFSGNGHPILNPEGDIVGYFGLSQDISALKNAQFELKRVNKNLESIVADRTLELEMSSRKLKEVLNQVQLKNDLLQQYTYIVSHNLRAPVANIVGLSELFDFEDVKNKENGEILRHIYKVTKHLDKIIQDLNEILSAEGQIENAKSPIDLNKEIERVCEELQDDIQGVDADIRISTCKNNQIEGVRSYIFSILHNLIENALKYKHPDRKPVIEIGSKVSKSSYSFWVKDNGIGIDLDNNEEILFKPRCRIGGANARGMGMGLFLVKTHIEQLGGEIFVESVVGEGSKFSVYFAR